MVSYGFVSNYSILDEIRDIGYRATELIQFTGFPGGVTRAREVRHLLQEANLVGVGNMHYLGFGGPDVANSLDRFIAEDKAAGMRNFGFVAHRTTPATQTGRPTIASLPTSSTSGARRRRRRACGSTCTTRAGSSTAT